MMKYFRKLSIGAALLLCLSLCAPMNADAASSQKTQTTVQKSSVKKSSRVTAKNNAKNSASKSKNGATKKTASKSAATAARASTKAKQDDERELWLNRAKRGELLTGKASWYGRDFHNKATASGLNYDMYTFTAAHRTLPMGTVVKVTDQHNGKSVMVCVTDRGPYVHGRIIDLSYAAANQLGLHKRGVSKVQLEVVSDEKGTPLKADQAYFVKYASDNGKSSIGPFNGFADAAAMHEAIRQAHPEAEVVLERVRH